MFNLPCLFVHLMVILSLVINADGAMPIDFDLLLTLLLLLLMYQSSLRSLSLFIILAYADLCPIAE